MVQTNVRELLTELPFYNMDNREFNNFGLCSRELNIQSDLHNLLCNPDKRDEFDPDLMLSSLTSSYYSMSNVNNVLNNVGSNSLSLFHCNIRSLPKNLTLLNDLIYTLDSKPDVIACTETRLNNDT